MSRSLEDAWHAPPQLFFKCLLRPSNGRPPKNQTWTRGPDDIEACLVFFSTFEELKLPATGPMDRATTNLKLYKPSSTPILYVAPCKLMLGRVPLFPYTTLFRSGNLGRPSVLRAQKALEEQLRTRMPAIARRPPRTYQWGHPG